MKDADGFQQLLHATLSHLERLRREGVQHVSVEPETLERLRRGVEPAIRKDSRASSSPQRIPVESAAVRAGDRVPGAMDRPGSGPAVAAPAAQPGSGAGPEGRGFGSAAGARRGVSVHGPTFPPPPEKTPDRVQRLDPKTFREALEALRQRALACTQCSHLVASRTQVVFGVGDPDAELMFVGEAPGEDEDLAGEPFVGKAGQLLTRMIQAMGLAREQVYIANILKCRPDTPGQTSGNRKPTPAEMETCIPYLQEQIDMIQPRVLVALGTTAIEGLLGKQALGITRLRGNWTQYRGIPLMPTYHPAYVLRNQAISVKRQVWEDLMAVMERLGIPISDKQQRFFTASAN